MVAGCVMINAFILVWNTVSTAADAVYSQPFAERLDALNRDAVDWELSPLPGRSDFLAKISRFRAAECKHAARLLAIHVEIELHDRPVTFKDRIDRPAHFKAARTHTIDSTLEATLAVAHEGSLVIMVPRGGLKPHRS